MVWRTIRHEIWRFDNDEGSMRQSRSFDRFIGWTIEWSIYACGSGVEDKNEEEEKMSMAVDSGGRTGIAAERDIEQVFGYSLLALILFSTAYII